MDDDRILDIRKRVLERILGRPLSRREFMQLLASGAAGSILAACAPRATPTAPPPTPSRPLKKPPARPVRTDSMQRERRVLPFRLCPYDSTGLAGGQHESIKGESP